MNMASVRLHGHAAAAPDIRDFETGSQMARLLVTVRHEDPKRVDVIPCTLWFEDSTEDLWNEMLSIKAGFAVRVEGTLRRRFWEGPNGRTSRLEVMVTNLDARQK